MATIGRKKRTKKQTRIKQQHINFVTRRITGGRAKRSTALSTGSRFRQFLKNYDDAIARGELRPIKEIEELREKWTKYMNKDGTPSRSKLKSKKKREEWNADMKAFNKKYRRWGKKAVQDIAEKQRTKREKQANTFGENQARRAVEEATKQGLTTDIDFEQIAREESDKYLKMLEMFALDTFNKLREELNVGSRVIAVLSAMGLDTATIDSYLEDFRNAYMNIPQEARDLAKQDDLEQAILHLVELHGSENLTEVLSLYLQADSEEERQHIAGAGKFHAEAVNDGRTSTSFNEFWEEAHGTSSTKWGDFL